MQLNLIYINNDNSRPLSSQSTVPTGECSLILWRHLAEIVVCIVTNCKIRAREINISVTSKRGTVLYAIVAQTLLSAATEASDVSNDYSFKSQIYRPHDSGSGRTVYTSNLKNKNKTSARCNRT